MCKLPRILQVGLIGLFLFALVSGCQPTTSPIEPTSQKESTQTPQSTNVPETITNSFPIRLRLITNSDWTTLRIITGADLVNTNLISKSPDATVAEVQGNRFSLNQSFTQAVTGASVELVIEAQLTMREYYRNVLFLIERGDIGATRLDISRKVNNDWVVIKSFFWDGLISESLNSFSVKIALEEFFSTDPAEVVELPAPLPTTEIAIAAIGEAHPVLPIIGMPVGSDGYPWWNNSVFYEIFVRSFYDSNGDGIGDFNGITQKLDYLNDGDPNTNNDLGITGIWLMPINPTPSYHGYSVTDYYAVNPEYGSMEEFNTFLQAAHERGIRVIIDLVLNHTSVEHPWFQSAADPTSPYHDWYIWSDTNPGYTGSWGQQVWFPHNGKFFYSTFSAGMPDLNYTNPDVTAEINNIVRFWLEEVGVDGFRLDASKHLVEEGKIQANSNSTHEWYKNFRPFYKAINPEAVIVGEVWDETATMAKYLQGDEMDLSFEFYLAALTIQAINEMDVSILNNQLGLTYELIPDQQFATFLSNHDLDRVMSQFGDDPNKVRVAAAILLTAPGVPFLYYGEEIGMQGVKPDQQIRSPMHWSATDHAGFSSVEPWQPLNSNWEVFNVEEQNSKSSSLLSHYRNLIHARNQHLALRVGEMNLIDTDNHSLYSILRNNPEENVLVLINLGNESINNYQLSLESSNLKKGEYQLIPILGEGDFLSLTINSQGGFDEYRPIPEVPAFGVMVLQLSMP